MQWLLRVAGVVCVAVVASSAVAAQQSDREAVQAAANDYVEGFYTGDSTLLVRSVSPQVYKYGYALRNGEYTGMQMPYAGFMSFARGVREGRNRPPANARRRIEVLDVQDQTAAAKVWAWWGTDYLLLARQNGRWLITHVLWQSGGR